MNKENLINIIENIKNKDFKIYYFLPDFERPSGGILFSYQHVAALRKAGYNAVVIHSKKDFKLPWIGKYSDGVEIEYIQQDDKNNLTFKAKLEDIIVLPEGMPNWFEAFKKIPSKKIINCQNWYYILNALEPGQHWHNWGINDCLSLSQIQTEYINLVMPGMKIKYACGYIDNKLFTPSKHYTDKLPEVLFVNNRDQYKTANVIKAFYAIHPYLRWIKFKQVNNESFEDYAKLMQQSAFYLHVDDTSSLGTAPLEAFLCNTLVAGWDGLGGQEYMNNQNMFLAPNGDVTSLAMVLGEMITKWLENSIPDIIYEEMNKAVSLYTKEHTEQVVVSSFDEICEERILEIQHAINSMRDE